MAFTKRIKDHAVKVLLGSDAVPRGLLELHEYFRQYGPIAFQHAPGDEGRIIATSTNFRLGLIVTSGRPGGELEQNVIDAILTSFGVPSSYEKEAKIHRVETSGHEEYALA